MDVVVVVVVVVGHDPLTLPWIQ